jgi:lysozyme family protein
MSDRFSECLAFVLEREGGFVDHPADKGGATNKGITQAVYNAYLGHKHFQQRSVLYIADDEVAEIYKSSYWNATRCDDLPKPLDLVMFDAAVNHGIFQAIKFLQRGINSSVDGIVGPATGSALTSALNIKGAYAIATSIITQREIFYHRLVNVNPSQGVFMKGWMARLYELEKAIE